MPRCTSRPGSLDRHVPSCETNEARFETQSSLLLDSEKGQGKRGIATGNITPFNEKEWIEPPSKPGS
jgi:hypothetical protein